MDFAQTPEPPYYVAVITVQRSEIEDGYFEMADAMYAAAARQEGFLGMEWVSDEAARTGITASYWRDTESIRRWRLEADHLVAQALGKDRWYDAYKVRIARVERDYSWFRPT
jgi:heme-degrading monooxygenase HmoA